jgi:hypothetical protein
MGNIFKKHPHQLHAIRRSIQDKKQAVFIDGLSSPFLT